MYKHISGLSVLLYWSTATLVPAAPFCSLELCSKVCIREVCLPALLCTDGAGSSVPWQLPRKVRISFSLSSFNNVQRFCSYTAPPTFTGYIFLLYVPINTDMSLWV